jgi:hypothetical protein
MNNNGSTYNYSDIQRYVKGEMSSTEMRLLELAALDDPFLADALEGYRDAEKNITQKHHSEIESYVLKERKQTKVVPFFTRYKAISVAAVLLLIIGAAWFSLTLLNNDKDELAINHSKKKTEETLVKKDSVVTPEMAPREKKDITANDAVGNRERREVVEAPRNETRQKAEIIVSKENKESKYTIESTAAAPTTIQSQTLEGRVQGVEVANDRANKTVRLRGNSSVSANSKIAGIVRDDNGNALSNATVTVGSKSTLTDKNGLFFLPAADSNKIANISAEGMNGKEVKLNSRLNQIELESSATLAEVVVAGRSPTLKRSVSGDAAMLPSISIDTVGIKTPMIGWAAFQSRLMQNLMKARLTGLNTTETVISFLVNNSRKLRRVRIENTDSKTVANAIRDFIESEQFWMPSQERIRLVIRIK